jgi:hypothetical protein
VLTINGRTLAPGTLHAIYRQATRYVPERDLRPRLFALR